MLRAIAWLRSLVELDRPRDFQANAAGARALFEGRRGRTATLMHFDPATFSPEKMDTWEDSAKFKHAGTVSGYLADAGAQPLRRGADDSGLREKREAPNREAPRRKWWPNHDEKHPPRWAGRNLAADAQAADKLLAEGFEEFYRLRYPPGAENGAIQSNPIVDTKNKPGAPDRSVGRPSGSDSSLSAPRSAAAGTAVNTPTAILLRGASAADTNPAKTHESHTTVAAV